MARTETFDWMSVSARRDGGAAFERQFEKAVRERARLLFNLRYPASAATQRILAGLSWEFDTSVWPRKAPGFMKSVKKWVDDTYKQMTPGKK